MIKMHQWKDYRSNFLNKEKPHDQNAPIERLQVKLKQRRRSRAKSRHQFEQKKAGKVAEIQDGIAMFRYNIDFHPEKISD